MNITITLDPLKFILHIGNSITQYSSGSQTVRRELRGKYILI